MFKQKSEQRRQREEEREYEVATARELEDKIQV